MERNGKPSHAVPELLDALFAQGITLGDIVDAIGGDKAMICRWKSGATGPSLDNGIALFDYAEQVLDERLSRYGIDA